MGRPEQSVKRCLAEETAAVTAGGASWNVTAPNSASRMMLAAAHTEFSSR
jgi:hypothetical protein